MVVEPMNESFTLDNGEELFLDQYGAVSPESSDRPITVVALHGLGGGGYFFGGIAQSLALHGPVICPDMPGSGRSPRGDLAISFDRFADAIVQLIERKTPGPVALMGHSMGTIVALKVYARIPERIGSMIFVGGLPAPLPEARERLRNLAALARSEGMAAVSRAVVPVVFAPRSLDAIPDQAAMFQRRLAQSDPEGYAQTAVALADASAADVVPRVRVSCLCVTGTHDRYAPPAHVRAFADSLSVAVYKELPDCAHMPFFETPDALRDVVQSFLTGCRP
jgi:3-oxoadipate enol-lactonase